MCYCTLGPVASTSVSSSASNALPSSPPIAATSSGTNAAGAVANPTEKKEDAADEEKKDVGEENVESEEGKADEEGGVVDRTTNEKSILIIEEEKGDEVETTGGNDEDHQKYMDGLIKEAKGSQPADFLKLTVDTAVTAMSNIASPTKLRQAASYMLQSPTLQGMLPNLQGKSIEAEPPSEKAKRRTRNSKPSYT